MSNIIKLNQEEIAAVSGGSALVMFGGIVGNIVGITIGVMSIAFDVKNMFFRVTHDREDWNYKSWVKKEKFTSLEYMQGISLMACWMVFCSLVGIATGMAIECVATLFFRMSSNIIRKTLG